MKKDILLSRLFLPILASSLAFSSPLVVAEDEETPLVKAMDQTSSALKSLRRMDKNDWVAGAKAARDAADGIRKGMAFEPAIAKDMEDGKEKTIVIADFRRIMGLSYAALCELELAYIEESQEKVDAAMAKVKDTKKQGHKKYADD